MDNIQKKVVKIPTIELFVFFVAFSVITSMWTNLGTVIINNYAPSVSPGGIWGTFIVCLAVTVGFAVILSEVGLTFTDFGVPQ